MFCLIKLKRNTLSVLAVSDAFKACSEKVLFCTTMYVSLIKSERQSFSVSHSFPQIHLNLRHAVLKWQSGLILGLHDILHAIVMRISSVKPVL